MNLPSRYCLLSAALIVAAFSACSSIQTGGNAVARAAAVIFNVNGTAVGTAQLSQDANGLVTVEISAAIRHMRPCAARVLWPGK